MIAEATRRLNAFVTRGSWKAPLLVLLGSLALIGVVRLALTLGFTAVYGGEEGWNAYHQVEAMSGQSPYPGPHSLMYNVYPPLSFYVVGIFGALSGDYIVAGRTVSLIAFLLTALFTAQSARAMGCARLPAAFAAVFLMLFLLFDHGYVAVNSPQTLGQLFAAAGVLLCLREPRSAATMVAGAFCFSVAFFTKHNMAIEPIAVTLWLFFVDRRKALILAGAGLLMGVAGLLLFQWSFGMPMWAAVNSGRIWELQKAVTAVAGRIPAALPGLIAVLLVRRLVPGDKYLRFGLIYLATAVIVATPLLGGAGTGGNQIFSAEAALCLCGAVALDRLLVMRREHQALATALCFAIPLICIAVLTAVSGRWPRSWLEPRGPVVADTERDVAFLAAHKDPILCRELALCFRAGKQVVSDIWNVEQSVVTGRRDGHELIDAIRQRRYSVVQLSAEPNILGSWPDIGSPFAKETTKAIRDNYRLAYAGFNGTMWVPK